VGAHLNNHRLRHGELVELARVFGVSARTLRNWKCRGGREGRPGRPAHSQAALSGARALIEPRWRALVRGHNGWRTVCCVLERECIAIPTRLVQAIVRELKLERKERVQQRIIESRVHVEVLARDALWCTDQTQVGRDSHGAVKSLAVSDGLGPNILALSVGPPATAMDVLRVMEQAALIRGTWPLVAQFDNGSENHNELVEERMRREHVVILWNEPCTPQHNPRAEHVIGDLKLASGVCSSTAGGADPTQVPVWSCEPRGPRTRVALGVRLREAGEQLNAHTPRPALGGLTALELDSIAPRAEDRACRARFYEEVCEELQRIALAPGRARARRTMEREAIWGALERAGLVKRTRGGLPVPTVKAEGVS
jgi:hypothetical protein